MILTTFAELDLSDAIQRALADENYVSPTPIQERAIPLLLKGQDVLGCAQTGTGKTAAFALPILQHLSESKNSGNKVNIRALVMTPTRELAAQIGENFEAYGRYLKLKHLVIFGGVNERPQIRALQQGMDILVATPGRLLDLAQRRFIDLSKVEFFVLDEADRMLDMGFVHDVKKVLTLLPKKKQNLLFSATMPNSIVKLASSFLNDPQKVEVTPESTTVERIEQSIMFVPREQKRDLITELLQGPGVLRAIVFTRTKHGANRLVTQLGKSKIHAEAIHGNKSQSARRRALEAFRKGDIYVLVATDIAARGIDIDDVSHVFNYDLPNEPESYVHRIGRTARAGREGVAISFCDETEGSYLRDIQKVTRQTIPVVRGEFHSAEIEKNYPSAKPPKKNSGGGGRGRSNSGRSGRPNGKSPSRNGRGGGSGSSGRSSRGNSGPWKSGGGKSRAP